MKTKRFLSLLLALVMSLALAAPAFAADGPDDPDAGIMPLVTIYDAQDISIKRGGTYHSDGFTSTTGNGKYIKVWYANRSDHKATVYLYCVGQSDPVAQKTFEPNSYAGNEVWYDIPDTEPVTFYVVIEANNSGPIVGYLSVAQYRTKTE